MSYTGLVLVYILGGFTFLPLLLLLLLVHAYFTFPIQSPLRRDQGKDTRVIEDADDDSRNIKAGNDVAGLGEKFHRAHESDVASGYFAVCREYVPGGVNGKPPERTTPAGSTIAAESPSVYQSMYRTLFDRKQGSSLDPSDGNGKTVKRARNVFFVVLRHGHLMLYESAEQFEVKYVISLELHDVSIHGGEDEIPEGELWIKRNAIKLSRKATAGDEVTKPFFFFSENSSDKEDFYFALLQNQEIIPGALDNPPRPQRYDQSHIIGLVQRLHSSEEQLQTRWVNALIGRLFLAVYKTVEVEDLVRRKIMKKIARVKKPAFISNIVLQKINMGDGGPHITNPRLKDFTIDGDCCVEADFRYDGHFRIEVGTTVRIDLGSRFKAREVNLVLAIVVKKLNGHGILKFKPPPSNRVWIAFETMPDMEMDIEPIVSSRQITYGFILRTIEARIREVVAETLVLPHWDDIPFTDTLHEKFRGGVWVDTRESSTKSDLQVPDEAPEDEAETAQKTSAVPISPRAKDERVMTMPASADVALASLKEQPQTPSSEKSGDMLSDTVSTSLPKNTAPPKALRSRSFASAANPLVSMDTANFVDSSQPEGKKKKKPHIDATSAMMAISSRSRPSSPPEEVSPIAAGKPTLAQDTPKNGQLRPSNFSMKPAASSEHNKSPSLVSSSPGDSSPMPNSLYRNFPHSRSSSIDQSDDKGGVPTKDKRQTIAALNAATLAAKNWGWGVLNRNADQKTRNNMVTSDRAGSPSQPIGRGQPLPPPGQPLPFPDGQRSKTTPGSMLKKKASTSSTPSQSSDGSKTRADATPPIPIRRRQMSTPVDEAVGEGILVVEAPPESDSASPQDEAEEAAFGMEGAQFLHRSENDEEKRNGTKSSQPETLHNEDDEDHLPASRDLITEDTSMKAWNLEDEEI